jgi:NAD(P)-dependent dehydrogenase (short-subunit alcohol dehydrogenase family)
MSNGELSAKNAIVASRRPRAGRAMALGLAHAGANVMLTAANSPHEIDAVASEAA